MSRNQLTHLDLDLAYLALLTKHQLKRLSRWEGSLSDYRTSNLKDLGLVVVPIRRRALLGRTTHEVVFSTSSRWTDLYKSRFDSTRVRDSADDIRLKGFLFGYPSCCVEAFIRRPYGKNELARGDQRILFHWACSSCKATPLLLRDYRRLYRECVRLLGTPGDLSRKHTQRWAIDRRRLQSYGPAWYPGRAALPLAAGISALFALPQVGYPRQVGAHGPAAIADPHIQPVGDDQDSDFLAFPEEVLSGTGTDIGDTDGDGVLDGISQAYLIRGLIDSLPSSVQPDRPYKLEFNMDGVEYCDVCGEPVDMGFVRIVNPLRNLEMDLPFMCLHYLEHGSLSYMGTLHEGRLDLGRFKSIMLAADESHLLCTGYEWDSDTDQDGLGDREEAFVGTAAILPDTDMDSVKDGPQFIEPLLEVLANLPREQRESEPYLIEHYARGVETCEVCGGTFNMGSVEIVNPREGMTLNAPFVALHYLAHGSSAFDGTVSGGRIFPTALRTVLTGDGTSHWLDVAGDMDNDGLKDDEEARFSMDSGIWDSDGDGIPDGPQLALLMHRIISELPQADYNGPFPDTTHVVHYLTCGVYRCLVCDCSINMGFMEIVNPASGDSVTVPYENFHFMEHGGFCTDRPDMFPRIDPKDIDDVIDVASYMAVHGDLTVRGPLVVYPNPFRTSTRIVCSIPRGSTGDLGIYDTSGRLVVTLAADLRMGRLIHWEGTDSHGRRVPPGIYFCNLKVGEISLSRKVVLIK